MSLIDRRTFLTFGGGAAAAAAAAATIALPLAGCGGGDNFPPVSAANAGPLAVASDGRQVQALGNAHMLLVTDKDGKQRRAGGVGFAQGKLNFPAGVATLGGLGYVVETGNHRVQVFDGLGQSVGTIGDGQLFYPSAIAAGKDELFVADARNARVVAFTPAGVLTRVIGTGSLKAPRGMEVSGNDLFVTDPGAHKVLRFGIDGTPKGELGSGWFMPSDVATDGNFIYVADASRSELGVMDMDGNMTGAVPLDRAAANVWIRNGTLFVTAAG
jgi:DNA-binding beta-propeller fold protein YncE